MARCEVGKCEKTGKKKFIISLVCKRHYLILKEALRTVGKQMKVPIKELISFVDTQGPMVNIDKALNLWDIHPATAINYFGRLEKEGILERKAYNEWVVIDEG